MAFLLTVAFVATVIAVIAGVRLVMGTGGVTGGTGLILAPACPAGITCATFDPPAAPTDVAEPDAGRSPSAQPPTAVPSPDASGAGKPSPARTSRREVVTVVETDKPGGKARKKTASPTPKNKPKAAAAPKRVVVKYTVLSKGSGQYTAQIAIGNNGDGDLKSLEIRLPIGGQVFAVDGARAVQQGQVLVLTSTDLLPSGGGVAVTIAANGTSVSPDSCSLTGGSCQVL
jgi:hypothetical protein